MEMRLINETLLANTPKYLRLAGRHFKIISLSSSTAITVEAGRNGQLPAKLYPMSAGDGIKVAESRPEFTEVQLTSSVEQTIVAVIADSEILLNSVLGTFSISDRGATITPATKAVTGVSTQMYAANSSRRHFAVQNHVGGRGSVYLNVNGGAAVANTTCVEIPPGTTYCPPTAPRGAINMINFDGGANISVYTEEG